MDQLAGLLPTVEGVDPKTVLIIAAVIGGVLALSLLRLVFKIISGVITRFATLAVIAVAGGAGSTSLADHFGVISGIFS